MNKEEDYASESDQSDEDFCPNGMQSDVGSEEESEDISEEDNEQDETSTASKATKRKTSGKGSKRKSSRRSSKRSKVEKNPESEDEKVDVSSNRRQTRQREETDSKKIQEKDEIESDEEDKSRSDALWADFLSDVKPATSSSSNKSQSSKTSQTSKANETSSSKIQNGKPSAISVTNGDNIKETKATNEQNGSDPVAAPKLITVTEVVDFAGEAVTIQKTVSADSIKENKATVSKLTPPKALPPTLKRPAIGGGAGGLGSILNQIGKKKKISVLEKTKLDWNTFKQTEGIEEDLQTFNKGKDGFLERQDFLQRTDVRQFEIEKSLRQSRKNQ